MSRGGRGEQQSRGDADGAENAENSSSRGDAEGAEDAEETTLSS